MAKVITTVGACSTKKKPVGFQFLIGMGESSLEGSYSITGDTAIVSGEPLPGKPVIGSNFAKNGCKYCGNKHVFFCGCCNRFVCYDGRAAAGFVCPSCGNTAKVPAASGNDIPRTASLGGHVGTGEVVRLKQGEEVKIEFSDRRPLTRINVGVGWDPARGAADMDVDSSVVVAGGSSFELIYFGNLEHPSGCVSHKGDNLTGDDLANADDENIVVQLDKVPANRDKLIFILNVYDAKNRDQTLGDVRNMYIRLYDPVSKQPLIEYNCPQVRRGDLGLVIGMAYRAGGGWCFKAIGEGSRAEDVHVLAAESVNRY